VRRACQVFAIGCLLSGRAGADHGSVHATAAGDVAATDNVFAVGGDTATREPDVYVQIRPGLLATYETPRMIHSLTAELEVLEYLEHSDSPSLTVRGGWQGFFQPGPRSEVVLAVNGGTGRLNALTARTAADQTAVTVTPAGTSELRQADASEYLSWQSTKETRTSETAFARWSATNDDLAMPTTTNSFETGLALGFDRSFSHDTFGLEVGGSFLRLELVAPAGATQGSKLDRQINPRASAVWRHDLSKLWSVNLDGGVVYVNPVGVDPYNSMAPARRAEPYPIFGGVLAYTDVWGRATLSARRAVSPNLFIAQNTLTDSAIAQLALPLPWLDENPNAHDPKLVALGSLGVERTQLVDPATASLVGEFDLGRLDIGLGYTPQPGQTYGLRYELVIQHGDAAAQMVTPSYFRDTLFFTFTLRYPGDVAVQVPRRTQSVRSDRSDLAPIGAEPVVPDAAIPAGGE
jgi:hypothetical protein